MNDSVQTMQETEQPAHSEGPSPEIIAEAERSGWVPKEKFRGDPAEWADAETFVKRGKEINPFLRKSNESLKKELNEAKAELTELKLTTKEFAAEFAKMKENAYKRAISELKAERREAIKEEDLARADELEERIDELKEEQKAVPAKKEEDTKAPAPDMTAYNEWKDENRWYRPDNEEAYDMAEVISLRLRKEDPSLVGRAFLDEVTRRVKKRLPEVFENKNREKSPHEGPTARGTTTGKRSYASLPADAKAACDKFVKAKLMTQEQYLNAYEWD